MEMKCPPNVKLLSTINLTDLSSEIRKYLINSVSKTGGHIGANLGVIELTIALHYCFDIAPSGAGDALFFDVGHQGYTHKLLTGRMPMFETLNQMGGMSRFISNHESEYDLMEASHAGTSISIASGMAYSRMQNGVAGKVIALIGDGSLVEGMSFEGLNFAPEYAIPLVIVINDNGMSIPPNIGAIHTLFSSDDWQLRCRTWFEGMGLQYIPVDDGHDIEKLLPAMNQAKCADGPVIVHVKTEKGRGLELAKTHPYKLHFSMPFNPDTGAGIAAAPNGQNFQAVVGEELSELMDSKGNIYVLSPATPYASGIESLMKKHPDRALDVGMAEQHAVGMGAGLAMAGNKVFVCFQSTFMQRALDQLFHDISYPQLPVTIISSRSGFAGFDGPTHHGIYDFGLLRSIPDLPVFYAGTQRDLRAMIKARAQVEGEYSQGPMVILHPYEGIPTDEQDYLPKKFTPLNEVEIVAQGVDGLIIAVANRLSAALELRRLWFEQTDQQFAVVNLRWVSPLPEKSLSPLLETCSNVVVMEEGFKPAGVGVALNQLIQEKQLSCDVLVSAIDKGFVPAGDKWSLCEIAGIAPSSVLNAMKNRWFANV